MISLTPEGIALIAVIAYWAIIEALKNRGILEKYGLSAYGPILIVRTKKGLALLEKISKPKRFWRFLATAGIPAVFAGMAFMFALVILMDIVMIKSPPPPSPVTSPRNALLIPWVNTLFPPLYLLIGLVVTLVVHEFSHAILCRVEGIKVKSLGLLMLIAPIGGFAEPDEEELEKKATRMQKIRIFSAGVVSNFAVASVAFAAFIFLLNFLHPVVFVAYSNNPNIHAGDVIYSINGVNVSTPSDVTRALLKSPFGGKLSMVTEEGSYTLPAIYGVRIAGLYKDYPAEKAGLKVGMIIYQVNNQTTPTLESFEKVMKKTKPGEVITLHVYWKGKTEVFRVKLAKSPYSSSGFLGVEVYEYVSGLELGYSSMLLEELKSLPHSLWNVRGWLYFVAMPLMGFKGFIGQTKKYFKPEILGDKLFFLLTSLYWIGWVDFYVGLFNCLPAVPLDGGRVFYEVFAALLEKMGVKGGEKIAGSVVKYLAYLIFASLIMSIVVPNVSVYVKWLKL